MDSAGQILLKPCGKQGAPIFQLEQMIPKLNQGHGPLGAPQVNGMMDHIGQANVLICRVVSWGVCMRTPGQAMIAVVASPATLEAVKNRQDRIL